MHIKKHQIYVIDQHNFLSKNYKSNEEHACLDFHMFIQSTSFSQTIHICTSSLNFFTSFFFLLFSFLIFLYSLYAPKNGMWDSIYSSINRCRIKRKTQKWCHEGQEHSTSYEFKVLFRCIQLFEHRTKKTEKTKARDRELCKPSTLFLCATSQ